MNSNFDGLIPIALFNSVKENKADDQDHITWNEFVDIFLSLSGDEIKSKQNAKLFTSTHFENGRRKAANAENSAMLVLDVDSGATVEKACSILKEHQLTGCLYTTASHTVPHQLLMDRFG